VEKIDFVTSVGHGAGADSRASLGLRGRGPVRVVTDIGVLEPDPDTRELTLTRVHPGVDVSDVRSATGWDLRVAPSVEVTEPPTEEELTVLRGLMEGSLP
jgi:glutaconate CoA-transferase, subunit B